MMEVDNLRADFGINHIERLSFGSKQCVALVGPNGAGKSTFLRLLFGRLSPSDGLVTVDGVSSSKMTVGERLKHMSYLPSSETLTPGLTVFDSIALGFHAVHKLFDVLSIEQNKQITTVLKRVSMSHKAQQPVQSLSSGEYQRVRLARLLIQPAPILLLDEPFSFLDAQQALNLMDILSELRDAGKTIIMSLHELNHAARICDRIIIMNQGNIVGSDDAESALNSQHIRDVFGVDFVSTTHPVSEKTHLLLPAPTRPFKNE
jgi:iron complex transport system ATP-binding protein